MRTFTKILDRTVCGGRPSGGPLDGPAEEPATELVLDHEQRRRVRLRIALAGGGEAALRLPRGSVLRHGDRVADERGESVARIVAAPELVSVVESADPFQLARAAYHLGNRHVPLELAPGRLAYPHDHVLDGLCRELGLEVIAARVPFEPELGGYGAAHRHRHDHDHDHDHDHHHE